MAKFKALEIAGLYIELANSVPNDSIDNLKLNKILYFAQGRFLSELGYPIFEDDIQAWDYGPVVPAVYRAFKCCGKHNIECAEETFDESRLNSKEINLLIDVYENYGKYTGAELTRMTHRKNSPWSQVYRQGENNKISHSSMKEYFSKDKDFHKFNIDINNVPIITEVPSEWDSEEDEVYDV